MPGGQQTPDGREKSAQAGKLNPTPVVATLLLEVFDTFPYPLFRQKTDTVQAGPDRAERLFMCDHHACGRVCHANRASECADQAHTTWLFRFVYTLRPRTGIVNNLGPQLLDL